jgi:hypothetical protein
MREFFVSFVFWLAVILPVVGCLAYRGGRVWVDAGQRGFEPARRLGWALLGAVAPARYWWGARIEALSPEERDDLLARETAALGLSRADSLRCPLCGTEVPGAWTLSPGGRPIVAPGPVECPGCDFRLDTCRHCEHFLPGDPLSGAVWGQFSVRSDAITYGRCGHYRKTQPVEQACAPEVARRLKSRGWERVRAPYPVVDSFVPPDCCQAFRPDRKRLKAGGVRWPDVRRVALLRLMLPPPAVEEKSPEGLPSGDEQWLL